MHAKSPHLCPTLCDPMDWWTVVCQAPLSMGFSRREYWSGWPCPLSGDLPDSGIENVSLTSPALAGRFFTTSTTWEAHSPGRWVQLFRVLRILYYHPSWELGWGLTFPVLWRLLVFQVCWHSECSTLIASSFKILNSSAGIPSPPLALLAAVLPKAHLTSHSRMNGSRGWSQHHVVKW